MLERVNRDGEHCAQQRGSKKNVFGETTYGVLILLLLYLLVHVDLPALIETQVLYYNFSYYCLLIAALTVDLLQL